jgi:hypothetical protein
MVPLEIFHRLQKNFKTDHVRPVICQFDMPVVEKGKACQLIHHIFKKLKHIHIIVLL